MGTNERAAGSAELEKRFLKIFHRICRQHHALQVWRDFVTMSACAIANAVDCRADVQKLREDSYMETVKRYSKEETEQLCELLAVTVMALDDNPAQDFLGSLYMKLNLGNGHKGQFFTPWHIAELMAGIQMDGALAGQIESEGYISVNDPCCGAGCMLMAFADVCKNSSEVNYQQSVFFVGQDIDPLAAMMCYIQISLLGCPGYVVVGNSLTECACGTVLDPVFHKPEEIWFTPLYFADIWTIRRFCSQADCGGGRQTERDIDVVPKEEKTKAVSSERIEQKKVVVKKHNSKKKPFSWKDFFTVKGKGKK